MSKKRVNSPRLPRRRKAKIEPIHVEELLGGAGMSGFLGVLDAPAPTPHLQELVDEVRPYRSGLRDSKTHPESNQRAVVRRSSEASVTDRYRVCLGSPGIRPEPPPA